MQKFPFKAALSLTAFSAAMLIASAPAEAREILRQSSISYVWINENSS